MESFKRTDLFISVFLITGSLVFSLVKNDETFIYCYFIVGGWQVISMIVHAVNGWFTRKRGFRIIYHWLVVIIIAAAALTFTLPFLFYIYYIMLFAAPLMAICYTILCYTEVIEIKKRHSLALK